tara:strand:+ start:259 stop:837 length:579 start_codon:yes stop_codon:yes gene_type:complete
MNSGALNWRSVLSLVLIAATCGIALVWINDITAPRIAAQRQEQARALMRSLLLPQQQTELNTASNWRNDILSACTDWWLLRITENGYAGPIELLAYWQTFDDDQPGLIKLRVLRHLETPGIGDFIDHERSDYLPERDGSTLAQWQGADALSGATVTYNALRRGAEKVAQRLDSETRNTFCSNDQRLNTGDIE